MRAEAWGLVLAGGLPAWAPRGPAWAPHSLGAGRQGRCPEREPAGSGGAFCDRPHGSCIARRAAVAVPPRLEAQRALVAVKCQPSSARSVLGGAAAVAPPEAAASPSAETPRVAPVYALALQFKTVLIYAPYFF